MVFCMIPSFEHLRTLIQTNQWFRQAAASRPLYLWTPVRGVALEVQCPIFFFSKGTLCEGYLVEEVLNAKAQAFLEQSRHTREPIDRYLVTFHHIAQELNDFFAAIQNNPISKRTNTEIFQLLQTFDPLILRFWSHNWLCDMFDPQGDVLLQSELKRNQIALSAEEIALVTTPQHLNFLEKCHVDLCRLALAICNERHDRTDEALLLQLISHANKYAYVQNSWLVVKVLEPSDFLAQLKELLLKDETTLKHTLRELEEKPLRLLRETERLLTSKNIPTELRSVFYLFTKLSELRDVRKEYMLQTNQYLYQCAQVLAERYHVALADLLLALPLELTEKNLTHVEFITRLKTRALSHALFIDENGYSLLEGSDAQTLSNAMHRAYAGTTQELKGHCASQGKAEGVVRIILSETHFSKFHKGDVLVAPMTRPEYVPLMQRASAIVTDEGGLTSHAAVIARELGIPCIIGTKLATKKLCDGQRVEVDADLGMVRVLEEKT